jgi:hypothetical protein
MNVSVQSAPYFLGGTQRIVTMEGGTRLSIVPQPRGNTIHARLFEVAIIQGEAIEVVAAYVPEAEVRRIVGKYLLFGHF